MNPRSLSRLALAGLVGLAVASLALVPAFLFAVVPAGTDAVRSHHAAGAAIPPGIALAVAKVLSLGWLFVRVARFDVYTLQWSSMFILLFFAEGVVRATSDPAPFAVVGIAEALLAMAYFAVVLTILRPLKRQSREREAPR